MKKGAKPFRFWLLLRVLSCCCFCCYVCLCRTGFSVTLHPTLGPSSSSSSSSSFLIVPQFEKKGKLEATHVLALREKVIGSGALLKAQQNQRGVSRRYFFFYHFNPKGRGLFVLFSHKRSSLFASLMIRIKRLEKDQGNKTKDGGWASHRRVCRYRDWRAAGWKAGIAIRLGRDCLGRAGLLLFIF